MGWKEEDTAPTELGEINRDGCYKDVAPDGATGRAAVRPVPTDSKCRTLVLEQTGSCLRLLDLRFLFRLHRTISSNGGLPQTMIGTSQARFPQPRMSEKGNESDRNVNLHDFLEIARPLDSVDRKLRRVARLSFHSFALYQIRSAVGSAGKSKLSRKCFARLKCFT